VETGLARTKNTVLALALAKQRGRHHLVVEREIEAAGVRPAQHSIGGLNCDSTSCWMDCAVKSRSRRCAGDAALAIEVTVASPDLIVSTKGISRLSFAIT